MQCPCFSGKSYANCCEPIHLRKKWPTPLELMRSRFSAYAMKNVDYIIQTTHPNHEMFKMPSSHNKKELLIFVMTTQFKNLKVLSDEIKGKTAFVTFEVELEQNGEKTAFREKSRFLKKGDQWLYESGELKNL
jgi:SEC-C motif-containing protein